MERRQNTVIPEGDSLYLWPSSPAPSATSSGIGPPSVTGAMAGSDSSGLGSVKGQT